MASDLYTSYLIGFMTAAFTVSGICFIVKNHRLNKILGIILIIFGVMMSKDILYLSDAVKNNRYFYNSLILFDNWAIVFGYLYILEVLKPFSVNLRVLFMHLAGFFLLTVLYMLTGSKCVMCLNYVYTVIYIIVNIIYLVYSTVRYRKMMKNMYSDYCVVNVSWVWISTVLLLFLYLDWLGAVYIINNVFDISYYVIMLLTWAFIVYRTSLLSVDKVYVDEYNKNEKTEKTEKKRIETADADGDNEHDEKAVMAEKKENYSFYSQLDDLLENGYFSRHPQLTLSDLATELNTNRTTLSTYINNILDTNYYDMVNEARLKVAEKYLLDPESNYTQEELAFKSGFNSSSTFKRAFKKKYSMTPFEFKKSYMK